MSIALNFLLGRVLAERTGVKDEQAKNTVAVVTMGLGLTPMGVVLARHVALQRAEPPPPVNPPTPAPPPGDGTGTAVTTRKP